MIIFVCERLRAGILSARDTGLFQGAALGGVEELVVGGCMAPYEMTFKHFQDGTEGFIMGWWINYGLN